MKFRKYFSKNIFSSTETHPTIQPIPQSIGENPDPESSPNGTTSTSGIQPALGGSNQPVMVPQSIINPGTPGGQVQSADQATANPALNNTDKILSALQAVAGMTLPLALPQAAKSASQLLTLVEDKRKNDEGIRLLVLDISKIILALVKPLETRNPTVTTEQEKIVADVLSYLEMLHTNCEEYLKGNYVSRLAFSSAWKEKISGIRQGVQTQLQFVSTTAILEVLNRLNATPHETSESTDQAFQGAEFADDFEGNINNFTVSGADQSRPIPVNQESSNAFKGAKIRGKGNFNNHHRHFGPQPPW